MSTSAGDRPQGRVPSIRRRLASLLYDSLLGFAIALLAGFLFQWIAGEEAQSYPRHAFQLYLFTVLGAYFVTCWSRGGRTLAMQTWKMRLTRVDGRPLGVARALLRYALAWPSLSSGIGLLWALLDRDKQFLHDRLAGTRIVLDEVAETVARV